VTQSAEAQAAIEFVLAYQAARNAWEREAWQRFTRRQGPETDARNRERYMEVVNPFLAASGAHEMAFGDPPLVDPGRTEVIGVKRRGTSYVVATREPDPVGAIWYEHRYIVVNTDGARAISDIRMRFGNSRWISILT
jgi:hypothetical protein